MFDTPKRRPGRGGGDDGTGHPISPNTVVRIVLQVFALFSLGFWGYLAWPFPFPSLFFVIGAPLFAAVVWWLFRSPRGPLKTDPLGRAIVEIAVMGSAAYAWFSLGYPLVAAVFAVVALGSGIIHFRRELRAAE
ncbi:YrdB family protein [Frondihabitans sp. Leaf304]|uniref:YrdB family protein n=1 Tax=Frondihabitans sp. Leaf304 TaxID=1736329 RepID=UPI000A04F144|nr:YrdB family protein [Frondihabitans sp. Leaf304]